MVAGTNEPLDLNALHGENCPNLIEEMQALLNALAQRTHQRICEESQILFDLMAEGDQALDLRIGDVEVAISALTNVPDFSAQITALKSLVDSLDLDQDGGVVNDLLKIQGKADQAIAGVADLVTRIDGLESSIANNTNLLQTLSQNFSTFQQTVNNAIQVLTDRINALTGRVDTLENTTGGLRTDVDQLRSDLDNFDPGTNSDLYCALSRAFRASQSAFVAKFDEILGAPCEIGASSSSSSSSSSANEEEPDPVASSGPSFASGL